MLLFNLCFILGIYKAYNKIESSSKRVELLFSNFLLLSFDEATEKIFLKINVFYYSIKSILLFS